MSCYAQRPSVRVVLPLFVCLLTTSCKSLVDSLAYDKRPIPNDPEKVTLVREAVTPQLLSLVDSEGFFRYPVPNVGAGEMPLDTALAQAILFLDYAQNTYMRLAAEVDRGAFIEMGKLKPCGQMHFVRSKYEPPPDSVHRVYHVRLGNHWSIAFCGGFNGPDVVVTVATQRNRVRFIDGRPTGRQTVVVGPFQSTEYVVRGLPWWWGAEHLVTPEEAVNEVFAQTGVRTQALPELFRSENLGAERIDERTMGSHVACSVWRVVPERPLRARTRYTNREVDLHELFVADSDCPGPRGHTLLLTPSHEQPSTRDYPLRNPDSVGPGDLVLHYAARLRLPVDFESVTIVR
jgi:hypothetical protein